MLPVLDMQIPYSFCDLFHSPVYMQKLGSFNYWCFMCQSLKDQSFFMSSFPQSFPVGFCLFFFVKFYFILFLYLAVLSLRFSSCSEWGLLSSCWAQASRCVASTVAEHRL